MENELYDVTDNNEYQLPPKPMDIFSEFDELDDLDIINDEKSLSNDDSLMDTKDEKIEVLDGVYKEEDYMNTTRDISTLQDEILDNLEKMQSTYVDEKSNKENDSIKYMKSAFIYVSTAGFVILFICYGIYLYFVMHG